MKSALISRLIDQNHQKCVELAFISDGVCLSASAVTTKTIRNAPNGRNFLMGSASRVLPVWQRSFV